ncbi:60S ribosomal protein L21 [Camelus dromedarius]|uniref:60S ribosomal protein L21 n=1 Tax=Camelus dromedarius TaxID=9838 RepID=A0A5N4CS48_CAMDR|nr:60S ribosomal protein L21 [Camelus dromedarius]
MATLKRVHSGTQHAVGIAVNKQAKGKIHAKRTHVWTEHSKHSESFLNRVKESDQTKKEAKEKGIWVELKRQSAPPREHFVRTNGRDPGLLEPVPMKSRHD